MSTCDICTEKYNKTTRKPITCPGCKKPVCATCVKAYILGSPHDPHCMWDGCKVQWTYAFMTETFPHSWIKGPYSEKEKAKVIDLEKALIPSTMAAVEQVRNNRKFVEESRRIRGTINEIQMLCDDIENWTGMNQRNFRPNNAPIVLVREHVERLRRVVGGLTFCQDIDTDEKVGAEEEKIRKAFVKPCPAQNCNGMMSGGYTCAVCNTKVCSQCFAVKRLKQEEPKEPHVCKEEDVQTALLIKKETKACPKCAVSIFKIEGCNQMWCTNCNTAFDWRSGQIINGAIHNPHFFEWQRLQAGNTSGDNQVQTVGCLWPDFENGHWYRIHDHLRAVNNIITSQAWRPLGNFVRSIYHIVEWARPRRYHELNQAMRISYIMGEMTEADFAERTYAAFKLNRFETARADIVDMLHRAAQSLVNNLNRTPTIEEKIAATEEMLRAFRRLALYYNKCMWDNHDAYKSGRQFCWIRAENFDLMTKITTKGEPRPNFEE